MMKNILIFGTLYLFTLCNAGTLNYPHQSYDWNIEAIAPERATEMLPEETIPDMVIRISMEIGLDPKLALALLAVENEVYNASADNYNEHNDSHDLGLFQLNDRFIHTDFVPRYWKSEIPFDPLDAESNAFVALSHLKYLIKRFDYNILNAIQAYNGGETAVASANVKQATVQYSYRVMKKFGYETN
jgi:hypothetical protein